MSIFVACSGCPAKLRAPESAAGKQIICPKCGTVAVLPALIAAEEVPVVDATVVSPAPKPKRVLADEVDSDIQPHTPASRGDDGEERPQKKKRPRYAGDDYKRNRPRRRPRRKSGGRAAATAVAALIGGLALVAVVGVAVYLVARKDAYFIKAPLPPGWRQYSYPDDRFRAYFPQEPVQHSPPVSDLQDAETFSVFTAGEGNDPVHVKLVVIWYRHAVPASKRDRMQKDLAEQPNGNEVTRVRWLGHDGVKYTNPNFRAQSVATDRCLVLATIAGPNGTRAKPEEEAAFFENFELTK